MRAVLQIGLLLFLPAAVAALEVNTAKRAQLERPAGLGVATTDRILRARAERPFADGDDLAVRVSAHCAAGMRSNGSGRAPESMAGRRRQRQ